MVSRAADCPPCTYPHSCACQQPAHSLGHRHTCSCLVCWHSVAHSDRCPVWSTHPSLETQRYVRALSVGPPGSIAYKRNPPKQQQSQEKLVAQNQKVQAEQKYGRGLPGTCHIYRCWLFSKKFAPFDPTPLKKLAAKPALLTDPSETNFIHRWLELVLMSSGLS